MSHGEPDKEELGRLLNSAYREIDVWKEHKKHYRLAALKLAGGDTEKLRKALDETVDKLSSH